MHRGWHPESGVDSPEWIIHSLPKLAIIHASWLQWSTQICPKYPPRPRIAFLFGPPLCDFLHLHFAHFGLFLAIAASLEMGSTAWENWEFGKVWSWSWVAGLKSSLWLYKNVAMALFLLWRTRVQVYEMADRWKYTWHYCTWICIIEGEACSAVTFSWHSTTGGIITHFCFFWFVFLEAN
jgi:hypothetical protein